MNCSLSRGSGTRGKVEFYARGVDVAVAWPGGGTVRATGNSFAAPHVTGLLALIRSKHPELTPFELKTVLYRVAANVRDVAGLASRPAPE